MDRLTWPFCCFVFFHTGTISYLIQFIFLCKYKYALHVRRALLVPRTQWRKSTAAIFSPITKKSFQLDKQQPSAWLSRLIYLSKWKYNNWYSEHCWMYFVCHGQGVINHTVELLSYVSAMAELLGCASGMVETAIHPFSPSWLSTLFKGAFQEAKFFAHSSAFFTSSSASFSLPR